MLFNNLITIFLIVLLCLFIEKFLVANYEFLIKLLNINKNYEIFKPILTELIPPNPTTKQPPSSSILYSYEKAAICSDSLICSQIGRKTLQTGGTAVDAAISTLFCNGLIAMQSMGLGGGVLLNVYLAAEKRAYSIQGREMAPYKFKLKQYAHFQNATALAQSSLSIAVPTELMSYAVAHQRFGKLKWFELVQPTIELCYVGFILSKHQRDALDSNWAMVSKDPLLRQMFVNTKTNQLQRIGTLVKPPVELCRTYEAIAKEDPKHLYNGELVRELAHDLQELGSYIDIKDFQALNIAVEESIKFSVGAYDVHFMAAPSSGYIIAFIMQILSEFFEDRSSTKSLNALDVHRIVEALKFAFAKRWQLDVFAQKQHLEQLKCPIYGASIARLINDTSTYTDLFHYSGLTHLRSQTEYGTAHISVLAPNGDAVSATSSINFYFGSGRTGKRTGILFNNAMSDFNFHPLANYFGLPNLQHINEPKPGKSPMSSMSPLIVTDDVGNVRFVIGAAGGSKIISVLVQILIRVIWLGEDIKQAIDAARFHHQLVPEILEYEYGIQQQVIDELEKKGHQTKRYRLRGSAVCGVQRTKNGITYANADYRKDGGVDGY